MPANLFTAADAKSSAAVSRLYGERLLFMPMISGEYTTVASPDPDREGLEFIGTLSGELGAQNLSGRQSAQTFPANFKTRHRTATVEPAQLPPDFRKGDQIQALEQPGQPVYAAVEPPLDDGSGNRFLITLVTT